MIAQLSDDGLAKNGKIDATKLTITALCNSVFKNDNSARAFLDTVDIAVNDVTQRATEIGSYMNRVDSAVESIATQRDNLTDKQYYSDKADQKDIQTPEWKIFDKARRTKIIANVISDFLILQTSGGDQSIFYYEKDKIKQEK